MSSQTLTVDVPPGEWLTANGRYHWAERSRRTRALRARAAWLARRHSLPRMDGCVHVTAYIHTRTRGRMDPDNASPATKAIIDGLRDAGVLIDDDHEHLTGPDHRRGGAMPHLTTGWHRITLHITNDEEHLHE